MDLMRRDQAVAREHEDASAEFACLATIDADGQPHARFVSIRRIDSLHVTFWASGTSPKILQLNANGNYALTAYWPTLARQYRLQGGLPLDRGVGGLR
jgi:pyridoxamine 5'-phosphate oxidase